MLTELDMLSREGIELLEELRRKVEHAAESLYERRRMPVDLRMRSGVYTKRTLLLLR